MDAVKNILAVSIISTILSTVMGTMAALVIALSPGHRLSLLAVA